MKSLIVAGALSLLLGSAAAQQVGTSEPEVHPPLNVKTCTKSGGCTTQKRSVVIDANWRWVHNVGGYTNCYSGNQWSTTYCPDGATCAKNCALEGAKYESTYGITTSDSALKLKYVTGSNVGSRTYLMDSTDAKYEILKLKNREFSFDVDLSTLPCGVNGALYLSEMPADGGLSSTNLAGAKYGTGYCDAQCAGDMKFINGVANVEGWTPVDENSGTGKTGACCAEMDIWEANKISTAYTPHPCTKPGLYACKSSEECGSGDNRYKGVCDKDGCDFNAYRQGNKTFYGPGLGVDTTKPFTIVTQFLTTDGTDSGDLSDIRRFYIQGGKVIAQAASTFPELNGANSVSSSYCSAQKTLFGDTNDFAAKGGLKAMGQALDRGMVLVLSIWDDVTVNMLWLDAVAFPKDGDPSKPGIARGSCATTSGEPKATRAANQGAYVTYSNIRWGDLGTTNSQDPYCSASSTQQCSGGSTTSRAPTSSTTTTSRATSAATSAATTTTRATSATTTSRATSATTTTTSRATSASPSPSPPPSGNCSTKWSQCGGINWAGPTCCVSGTTCTKLNDYYFQCL
ncbi:glycosyl hydrolase family 7-domain-containing protein [Cladochytrium replicatum]|nr:glycosyl hydrolase family 7-domain-containing protein [Cladochytrium replicatum]